MGLKAKVEVPVEESEVEVPVEETAVAVAVPKEVATSAGKPVPSLADLRDAWDMDEAGGNFDRLVGTNGALYIDKLSLGEWADIQVYAHNTRTMVIPISSIPNDPAVKKNCRASYDHKTVFDRESGTKVTIEDYADSISGQFPKGVEKKSYYDIYSVVLGSDKNTSAAKGVGIIQVSISPTAVGKFQNFVKNAKFRELQGTVLPSHRNCLRLEAEPHNEDGKNYVIILFKTIPVDIVKDYTILLE
jgi:hypothetical protein